MEKINWETVAFEIISNVGAAKGEMLMALNLAKENKESEEWVKHMESSTNYLAKAGNAHMEVITQEANGVDHNFTVLFMHAEDQFLTAQTLQLVIKELIELWRN